MRNALSCQQKDESQFIFNCKIILIDYGDSSALNMKPKSSQLVKKTDPFSYL